MHNDVEVMLSIYVPTYNHENYIVQALESIRMQITDFSYEVLVGEDCSTDDTRNILKKYENKYPDFAKIYYREHNMHLEKVNNALDLKRRCRGKYIIALEGDDYWIDNHKIDKQIKFLENNPGYIAVSHNCVVVNKDSEPNGEVYRECYDEEYTFEHYEQGILPGQLTTLMMRNYYRENLIDTSFVYTMIPPGDRRIYFSLLTFGKIYCIQEVMSAYRHVTNAGSSYSATVKSNIDINLKWYYEELKFAYRSKNNTAIKCAEALFLKEIISGLEKKQISMYKCFKNISRIRNVFRATKYLLIVESKAKLYNGRGGM